MSFSPAMSRVIFNKIRLLRASSNLTLGISTDETSATFLDNLLWWFISCVWETLSRLLNMVKINESNNVRGNWISQGKLPHFLYRLNGRCLCNRFKLSISMNIWKWRIWFNLVFKMACYSPNWNQVFEVRKMIHVFACVFKSHWIMPLTYITDGLHSIYSTKWRKI